MIHLRDDILKSQIRYYEGLIAKHKQNVEVYLTYPVGICLLYTSDAADE